MQLVASVKKKRSAAQNREEVNKKEEIRCDVSRGARKSDVDKQRRDEKTAQHWAILVPESMDVKILLAAKRPSFWSPGES